MNLELDDSLVCVCVGCGNIAKVPKMELPKYAENLSTFI